MDHYEVMPKDYSHYVKLSKGDYYYEFFKEINLKPGRYDLAQTADELEDIAEDYYKSKEPQYIDLSAIIPSSNSRPCKESDLDKEEFVESDIISYTEGDKFIIEFKIPSEDSPIEEPYDEEINEIINYEDSSCSYSDFPYNYENEYGDNETKGSGIVSYAEGFLDGLQQEKKSSQDAIAASKIQIEEESRRRECVSEIDLRLNIIDTISPFLKLLKEHMSDNESVRDLDAQYSDISKALKDYRKNL